jgi:hypothetical protein
MSTFMACLPNLLQLPKTQNFPLTAVWLLFGTAFIFLTFNL